MSRITIKQNNMLVNLTHLIKMVLTIVLLSSCLPSEDNKFDALSGGDLVDVENTTIKDFSPNASTATIQQGSTQEFSITAVAPFGRPISYTWKLNGSTVSTGLARYSMTGSLSNTGTHTLQVVASDGGSSDQKTWTVKVNGPPVLTRVTAETPTPKVSIGSTLNIQVSATDPNNDTLYYTWKLNGATSSNLTGTGATGTLTGVAPAGTYNVSVEVNDGSASTSLSWQVEVNHFPMACNQLTQGQICTVAGSPSIGDGLYPATTQQGIKSTIAGVAPDGNVVHGTTGEKSLFMADPRNNVIWYWNRSNSVNAVIFGKTVLPGQIKVVAGNGDTADSTGNSDDVGFYQVMDLWWDSTNRRLFAAVSGLNKVKYIVDTGTGGIVYDGITAGCARPTGLAPYNDGTTQWLYVACTDSHRVRRWDVTNDPATGVTQNIVGNGTGGNGTWGAAGQADSINFSYPTDISVTSTGLYVSAGRNIFAADNNCQGHIARVAGFTGTSALTYIIGTSGNNAPNSGAWDNVAGTAMRPSSITGLATVSVTNYPSAGCNGDIIYFGLDHRNSGSIYVYNGVSCSIDIGGTTIASGNVRRVMVSGFGSAVTGVAIASARVNIPTNMWVDEISGNPETKPIFIGDYNNDRLRTIQPSDWKVYTKVGSGGRRFGAMSGADTPTLDTVYTYPSGVVYDNNSRTMVFFDMNNNRVWKQDKYGEVSLALGTGTAASVYNDGDLGVSTAVESTIDLNNYRAGVGMAMLSDGTLFYPNINDHNVRLWNRTNSMVSETYFGVPSPYNESYTVAGSLTSTSGNGTSGSAQGNTLNQPQSVAVFENASSTMMYISDSANHCVKKVNSSGTLSAIAGVCGTGGAGGNGPSSATTVNLQRPQQVATDHNGNVYVADYWNNKIRFINVSSSTVTFYPGKNVAPNQILTIINDAGTTTASDPSGVFPLSVNAYRPSGVAANSTRFCYSDTWRHTVNCVTHANQLVSIVAGKYNRPGSPFNFTQDGVSGTSTNVRLYYPTSLYFDSAGDLYISDSYNHIIRKVKLSP